MIIMAFTPAMEIIRHHLEIKLTLIMVGMICMIMTIM